MKKLICAFLLLGMLLPCCVALADGGALARGSVAYVNNTNPTDRLNLRTRPSTQSVSLGKYYNGTWVTVLDVSGGWAACALSGRIWLCAGRAGDADHFVGEALSIKE